MGQTRRDSPLLRVRTPPRLTAAPRLSAGRPLIALASGLFALSLGMVAPPRAAAYERALTLDLALGWSFAPGLAAPHHGPSATLGACLGFDGPWGACARAGWAVLPAFAEGGAGTGPADPAHVGTLGLEAVYYIDILQVVPILGVGTDLVASYDPSSRTWRADAAAHLRVSLDYLVTRELFVGLDVRPHLVVTDLDRNPVLVETLVRLSGALPY